MPIVISSSYVVKKLDLSWASKINFSLCSNMASFAELVTNCKFLGRKNSTSRCRGEKE